MNPDQSLNMKEWTRISQAAADTAMDALQGANGRFSATWRTVASCVGSLALLAIVVAQKPDDEDIEDEKFNPAERVTNDTVLFAALLTAASVDCLPRESGGQFVHKGQRAVAAQQRCNFDAEAVYRALVNFEKLTGRKPDAFLNPGMTVAAREMNESKDGTVMLSELVQRNKTSH